MTILKATLISYSGAFYSIQFVEYNIADDFLASFTL